MTEPIQKPDQDEPKIAIQFSVMKKFFTEMAIDDPATVIAMLEAVEEYCRIVSVSVENERHAHVWDQIKQHVGDTCDLFDDLLHDTTEEKPEKQS